jgi:putative transposase
LVQEQWPNDFTANQPNQKWAGDISYIWTREGWLYLAVILDLHSRRVIALRVLHAKPFRVTAWAVSNRMKRDLAIRALKMAIALRSPPKGCIFHSDRGSQYCSHDYQKVLREHAFQVSPLADVNIRCLAADERQGQLLRQCGRRDLLQDHQGRVDLAQDLGNAPPSRDGVRACL